jgi:hypothetical protein
MMIFERAKIWMSEPEVKIVRGAGMSVDEFGIRDETL